MIKDFQTYISEGLFDRNQSEFVVKRTDKGIEQVYIPKTKDELCRYIDRDIEQAKKEGTYPNVNLNNIDVSELENDELEYLFSDVYKQINPDISNWNIKYIPNNFFDSNKQIKEFTIPNGVKCIGNEAFSDCSNLTSVKIPNSVTSIGDAAFFCCTRLSSVTIPDIVTSIGGYAFSGCSDLTSIVVENGNSVYDSRNNCNAIIETATNTLIAGCQSTIIPNNVTSIEYGAFYYCNSLTYIEIPNSVTSIAGFAFHGCSGLTSVSISKHCHIKSNSFPENCKIIRK